MRKWLKCLAVVSLFAIVLLALLMVRSTARGFITWYFAQPHVSITVDGRQTGGWLHRGNHGRTLFVTRSNGVKRESYGMDRLAYARSREHGVWYCQGWTAPHLPVLALNESNGWDWTPVCMDTRENPPERNPIMAARSVEFTTDDGRRLKASW